MGELHFGPARVPSRESPEQAIELLQERGFTADLYAHMAAQGTMLACAILLCLWVIKKRIKLRRSPPPPIV